MKEEVRAQVPEWAVGVAVSSRSLIVIRADLVRAGFGGGVVPVLRHEWVHLSWGRYAGTRRRHLPLWAEEGIAEEIGGGISVDAGVALDMAVAFDGLIAFQDLRERFPDDAREADLAYKQSRSWVKYFVTMEGWDALQDVLIALVEGADAGQADASHDPFGDAVRARTGVTLGEWHASWKQAVEKKAVPWYRLLLRDLPGVLLMLLSIVAAAAFFFLLRRRRRQLATLPDAPPHDDDPGVGAAGV
jgi:hypothetical protein